MATNGQVDWDRADGLAFATVDDSGGANVFGENCLFIGERATGFIFVKDSEFNQADQQNEWEYYKSGSPTDTFPSIGGRIIDVAGGGFIRGDGYWFAGTHTVGARAQLSRRVNGVFTVLSSPSYNNPDIVNKKTQVLINIQGTTIKGKIITVSTQAVLIDVEVTDSTFSGPGTAGIAMFSPHPTQNFFIDNFNGRDAA